MPPRWARRAFSFDVRSLAVLRMGMAALLLVDLSARAGDLVAHYTDGGVLPRASFQLQTWDFAWSFHTLGGSARFEVLLFAAAAVVALSLGVGFQTFWSTAVSWLFLVSLHGRNPLLRDGQDDLLRVLLFWSMGLPWGAAFSVDAWRARVFSPAPLRVGEEGVFGLTTVAFTVQWLFVYAGSALAKLTSPWWTSGHALQWALGLARYETPLGQKLLAFPVLLQGLTYLTLGVELVLPLGLLLGGRALRTAGVAVFVVMHLGFALGLELGLFPWVNLVGWLAFLPAWAWRQAGVGASPGEEALLPRVQTQPFVGAAVAVLLTAVLAFNLRYLAPAVPVPRGVQALCDGLGLQQYWSLFSPSKLLTAKLSDGWFVVEGDFATFASVDLLRGGGAVSWDRPPLVSKTFANTRWRQYFANIAWDWPRGSEQQRTVEASRTAYADLLCRTWNRSHATSENIVSVRVTYVHHPVGEPGPSPERHLLVRRMCPNIGGPPGWVQAPRDSRKRSDASQAESAAAAE